MIHPRSDDTALRLALLSMVCDRHSPLTRRERLCLLARGTDRRLLVGDEVRGLKTPLLTWMEARMPLGYDVIAAVFTEEG
jgi:hypothetical protein